MICIVTPPPLLTSLHSLEFLFLNPSPCIFNTGVLKEATNNDVEEMAQKLNPCGHAGDPKGKIWRIAGAEESTVASLLESDNPFYRGIC